MTLPYTTWLTFQFGKRGSADFAELDGRTQPRHGFATLEEAKAFALTMAATWADVESAAEDFEWQADVGFDLDRWRKVEVFAVVGTNLGDGWCGRHGWHLATIFNPDHPMNVVTEPPS